jgi:D-alanine-D-alanine ligase
MLLALRSQKIAILYQALAPPVIDGIRKDAKPGGYSDSGADIAFCLRAAGLDVLTPAPVPDPTEALDWVFADSHQGIEAALRSGATVLWANTVLFQGHPIETAIHDCWIVGQSPEATQRVDDKFATNALLRERGLPVAVSIVTSSAGGAGMIRLESLTPDLLDAQGLRFPLVVKPVRGRGSQGVTLVESFAAFQLASHELLSSARFGDGLIVEQYLAGEELTVTVMPRGADHKQPWALPPVRRFNHVHGVAPYNGTVAVTANSELLTEEQTRQPSVSAMLDACIEAATIVGARAPIRIDCRSDGVILRLFDLNMKPNMTGAGRPGREDQDSLSVLAARGLGWTYECLLKMMLADAWREGTAGVVFLT